MFKIYFGLQFLEFKSLEVFLEEIWYEKFRNRQTAFSKRHVKITSRPRSLNKEN